MAKRIVLGIVLLAIAVTPSAANPTWKLNANESTYSYFCKADDWIAIEGKGNEITITGECSVLEVAGSDNRITIESVGTIRISGNNNDVRYERATNGKKKPAFKIKGSANSVHRD